MTDDKVLLGDLEHLFMAIARERTIESPWLFEDALQEARIGAWQRLDQGLSPGIAVFKARQAATDVARGRRMTGSKEGSTIQHAAHDRSDSIHRSGSDGDEYVVDPADPSQRMTRIEVTDLLRSALAALSVRDREIVWMTFFEELTSAEVAQEFGFSRQRVGQILKASYSKMREVLEEDAGA